MLKTYRFAIIRAELTLFTNTLFVFFSAFLKLLILYFNSVS